MLESASRGGVCSGGCLLQGGVYSRGCLLWGGGLLRGRGYLLRGVCSQGGCLLPRGVSAPGGVCIPACTEADTPLLTESQTPVKTLPWPNFVAAGKKSTTFVLRDQGFVLAASVCQISHKVFFEMIDFTRQIFDVHEGKDETLCNQIIQIMVTHI